MGFDDGECYVCYAVGGGNNTSGEGILCIDCLANTVNQSKKSPSPRWIMALSQRFMGHCTYENKCDLCKKTSYLTIKLSLCEGHGGSEGKSIIKSTRIKFR